MVFPSSWANVAGCSRAPAGWIERHRRRGRNGGAAKRLLVRFVSFFREEHDAATALRVSRYTAQKNIQINSGRVVPMMATNVVRRKMRSRDREQFKGTYIYILCIYIHIYAATVYSTFMRAYSKTHTPAVAHRYTRLGTVTNVAACVYTQSWKLSGARRSMEIRLCRWKPLSLLKKNYFTVSGTCVRYINVKRTQKSVSLYRQYCHFIFST